MFKFLLIVQTLVAASLVSVILMQRSEGGGLGVGGSSSGFMTARGAADFLTRSTAVLGGLFVILSITLAAIAGHRAPADSGRYLARQSGRTGTRDAAAAGASRSSAEPKRAGSPARSVTAPKRDFFRTPGCASGAFAPKPRLPWRGSYLSPAAWSHRLVRVFSQPLSGRCFRRAATRSASGSSTLI